MQVVRYKKKKKFKTWKNDKKNVSNEQLYKQLLLQICLFNESWLIKFSTSIFYGAY